MPVHEHHPLWLEADYKVKPTALYGLDYDGTISEHIPMWMNFIDLMRANHIIPIIITMRFNDEKRPDVRDDIPIIYTGRLNKVNRINYLAESRAAIDVWVDDSPHFLTQNAYARNYHAPETNEWLLPKYELSRTTRAEFNKILKRQFDLLQTGWKSA